MTRVPFDSPKRILVTGARAPSATDLVRWLARQGHEVWTSDTLRFPTARACRDSRGYLRYPSPRMRFAEFETWMRDGAVDFDVVWPCCEEVFWLAQLPGMPLFAPQAALLGEVHHKGRFVDCANRLQHAVRAPESRQVTVRPGGVLEVPAGFVAKPVFGRFGFRTIAGPARFSGGTEEEDWIIQRRVTGKELSTYALACNGRVVAETMYSDPTRSGVGPCVIFRRESDAAIADFVREFARATHWNGQIAFDIIRDGGGNRWVLECNPRLTSGIHLFANPGSDTVHLAAARMFSPSRLKPVSDLWRVPDALAVRGDRAPLAMALLSGFELWLRSSGPMESRCTEDMRWP